MDRVVKLSATGDVVKRDGEDEEEEEEEEEELNIKEMSVKWAKEAILSCKICKNYQSKSSGNFRVHLSRKHGMPINAYRKKYPGALEPEHECKICGTQVAHSLKAITNHLNSDAQHNSLSLAAYFEKHILSTIGDILK